MQNECIHLADIAGYHEEKEEAVKLIDMLQNFALYKAKGASIPKGLLLCGEPGVGKTMFAKAISTEAGVPLYEFESSESENEEETIKSLKDLFSKAKETIPSIVFIDELDELVSTNDPRFGFQSDYSRKTLKTLLTEIDGISTSEGILVIATTNNKRAVPSALIRSGRLEKQITFHLPAVEDRAAIASLYLNKANITGINPSVVARKTEGFSGADIKSLINASIIESVRKKEDLSIKLITAVLPTIRFGEIKKVNKAGPTDAVCYHEIGHFLAQYELTGDIASISVEQYGRVAGHIWLDDDFPIPFTPRKDDRSAEEILDSVIVCLGGMAGEEVFLGKRYCGSRADLSNANEAIYNVLANGALGFEYLPSFDASAFAGRAATMMSTPNNYYAEERSKKIIDILNEKFEKAKAFILKWQDLGRMIFPILKEKEMISSEELTILINDYKKEHPNGVPAQNQ